jgi:dipeptidyl aminopeptidase/acylaminoacyl peptidase
MNADGSNQVRLAAIGAGDGPPVWSPDGSQVAFQSNKDGNQEIYTVNADGSSLTRLTNNSSGDFRPSWQPSGSPGVGDDAGSASQLASTGVSPRSIPQATLAVEPTYTDDPDSGTRSVRIVCRVKNNTDAPISNVKVRGSVYNPYSSQVTPRAITISHGNVSTKVLNPKILNKVITWQGFGLSPGEEATLAFTVTIPADSEGQNITGAWSVSFTSKGNPVQPPDVQPITVP